MSKSSTSTHYGSVAVVVHWVSAILILLLMGSGFRSDSFTDPAQKTEILSIHAPVGITVFLLTLFRLFWWWYKDTKPAPVSGMPFWQEKLSSEVQRLFYFVIVIMAVSGIGTFVLSGAGPIIFGGAPGPLPDFAEFPPRMIHGIGARAMVVLLVLHIAGALYHQFIKKDGLIGRMWFSK